MSNPFDRLLDQFVADATRMAQTMAMDALRVVLDEPIGPTPPAAVKVWVPTTRAADRPRRRRVVATAALADQIVKALRAKPGQTVSELGGELHQPTAALQPAIKTLIAGKRLRFRGRTRARRYSLVGSAKPKGRRAKPKTRRSKR